MGNTKVYKTWRFAVFSQKFKEKFETPKNEMQLFPVNAVFISFVHLELAGGMLYASSEELYLR